MGVIERALEWHNQHTYRRQVTPEETQKNEELLGKFVEEFFQHLSERTDFGMMQPEEYHKEIACTFVTALTQGQLEGLTLHESKPFPHIMRNHRITSEYLYKNHFLINWDVNDRWPVTATFAQPSEEQIFYLMFTREEGVPHPQLSTLLHSEFKRRPRIRNVARRIQIEFRTLEGDHVFNYHNLGSFRVPGLERDHHVYGSKAPNFGRRRAIYDFLSVGP